MNKEPTAAAISEAADRLWKELKIPDVEPQTGALDLERRDEVTGVGIKAHPRKGKPSPVTNYVRSLGEDPDQYKTTHEVAKELGISTQFLRKMAKEKVTQAPSFVAPFGRLRVYLYTKDDIEELRQHLADRRQIFRTDEVDPLPEPEMLRKARERE